MLLIKVVEGEVGVERMKAEPKGPEIVRHGCPKGKKILERTRRKGTYTSDWGGDYTSLSTGNSMTGH